MKLKKIALKKLISIYKITSYYIAKCSYNEIVLKGLAMKYLYKEAHVQICLLVRNY